MLYGKEVARLLSLDALRGITVAAMVLVNNPGTWRAVYPPLRHADWHGWTLTDLVFPFFLFIVGASHSAVLGPTRGEESGKPAVLVRVLRRSAVIFALGIVLNGFPWFDWATLRVPGVLQRIALCYLAAALIYLATGWRGQAAAAAVLLLGYWALMIAGAGARLRRGRSRQGGESRRLSSTARCWVRRISGRRPRSMIPRGCSARCPRSPPRSSGRWRATGWRGAPRRGRSRRAWPARAWRRPRWARCGDSGSRSTKALWTSSYALFTAGLAALALAACYWLIEARGFRRWAVPFAWFGVNALALFFLSTLAAKLLILIRVGPEATRLHAWLFERLFAPWAAPLDASLAWALAYVLVWWAAMWLMFRLG